MRYWLVKFAPFRYAWHDVLRNGQFEIYSVRSPQARNYLLQMELDDAVLFYHSQQGQQVMGTMRVTKTAHQDKTTTDERWVSVTFEPVETLAHPVSLRQIKENAALANIALVKQSRLAVMPVEEQVYIEIMEMGEL
jgi:predicted RNA-binding protein with PUA-like domain